MKYRVTLFACCWGGPGSQVDAAMTNRADHGPLATRAVAGGEAFRLRWLCVAWLGLVVVLSLISPLQRLLGRSGR